MPLPDVPDCEPLPVVPDCEPLPVVSELPVRLRRLFFLLPFFVPPVVSSVVPVADAVPEADEPEPVVPECVPEPVVPEPVVPRRLVPVVSEPD